MSSGKNGSLLGVLLIFGILYFLIFIPNHYFFRTHALDLGAYTNALYDYIHFQWNDSRVFKKVSENLLADHFDLYLILFSPLSLVFKTYTLLIVQSLSLLFGGLGVFKYFQLEPKRQNVAVSATVFFLSFFGVFAAISFDYHSNVVAAALVPWLFYLIKRNKLLWSAGLLLVILVSKENISLWMAFVCLGLLIEFRKNPPQRNFLIFSSIFCLVYFVVITSVVMPQISNENTFPHFRYSVLGENGLEAILFLIQNPLRALELLFVNHTGNPPGNNIKAELHILLLLSGLPFLLLKPQYLLMLIPIYFQKLFHDNYIMWSVGYQYSIEFAPILALGIFSVISELKKEQWVRFSKIVVLVGAIGSSIKIMQNPVVLIDPHRIRFYQADHYSKNYEVEEVHEKLKEIPADAIVSAQSAYLPHLSLRDSIYMFPDIDNAEYIVFSSKEYFYPMNTWEDFVRFTGELENSPNWEIYFKNDHFTILKKSQ